MFELTESSTTVKHVVARWKLLYKKYHQEHKKEKRYIQSGLAAPENEPLTWKYYDMMDFLEQHIQHRKTASHFKLSGDDNDWETDESDDDNDHIEHGDDQQYVHETSAHEINVISTNDRVDNAENVRPEDDYDNDYMLIFRDAWQKIPEQHRQNCFFKLRKMIRNKKQGLPVHD
ncbi:uncharacterized protein LOC117180166 isoform X2 [Belonocnema kinseyi]|uniref:uncharacterized protein LOC117180166 isoform X2 n=1 Tax=Belonocnema kinseyi TaxID=2817044 RepID=UPI00143CC374|nr:uncharacterized protein LOC117180166 isoform X2 [Belonocnema kinseyi]